MSKKHWSLTLVCALAAAATFPPGAQGLNYSGCQKNSATFETLEEARENGPKAVATLEGNTGRTFKSHPVLDGYPKGTTYIYRSPNLYGGRAAARLNTDILVFVERSFASKEAAQQYLKDLGLIKIADEAIGSVILVTPANGQAFGAADQKNYYALQTAMLAQKASEGGGAGGGMRGGMPGGMGGAMGGRGMGGGAATGPAAPGAGVTGPGGPGTGVTGPGGRGTGVTGSGGPGTGVTGPGGPGTGVTGPGGPGTGVTGPGGPGTGVTGPGGPGTGVTGPGAMGGGAMGRGMGGMGGGGAGYCDAEYFGGFGYTYVIGIDGGATYVNNYVAPVLDYVSRIAGMLLINGKMDSVRTVGGLVPTYLVNAPDAVVDKYKKANDTDAYATRAGVESFFDQSLPLKRVMVAKDQNPDAAKYIQDAYYNLFINAMRIPVGKPGLLSVGMPYAGYSMDQAPLSLCERNAVLNGKTRDGIHVVAHQENLLSDIKTANGEYVQTWFEYLPEEVLKNTAPAGSVPLILANHGGGDDPRQFVEEIGLLPLAGTERFAMVAPEHQSAGGVLSEALPKLVELTLKAHPALDPTRVYVTGYSMGGAATLRAINGKPSVFAAAVPMAAAGYTGTAEQVAQFQKAHLPVMFTTSSFDLAGAFDQVNGNIAGGYQTQLNLFLGYNGMKKIEAFDFKTYPVNGFKADSMIRVKSNGEYDTYRWYLNDADGVPMVALSYTMNLQHALYPEYGKIAWEFFKHYARDPKTGAIKYSPRGR